VERQHASTGFQRVVRGLEGLGLEVQHLAPSINGALQASGANDTDVPSACPYPHPPPPFDKGTYVQDEGNCKSKHDVENEARGGLAVPLHCDDLTKDGFSVTNPERSEEGKGGADKGGRRG
jgi:hypothetical protein